MKNLPKSCADCPAVIRGRDVSTDGFDHAIELTCGFGGKMIDSFYEHPGAERADKERASFCPL
jgi:hypothetical protein